MISFISWLGNGGTDRLSEAALIYRATKQQDQDLGTVDTGSLNL